VIEREAAGRVAHASPVLACVGIKRIYLNLAKAEATSNSHTNENRVVSIVRLRAMPSQFETSCAIQKG